MSPKLVGLAANIHANQKFHVPFTFRTMDSMEHGDMINDYPISGQRLVTLNPNTISAPFYIQPQYFLVLAALLFTLFTTQ